jgi:hypothetical protein
MTFSDSLSFVCEVNPRHVTIFSIVITIPSLTNSDVVEALGRKYVMSKEKSY